jgi:ribosomal protein L11 methyltransferase
MIEVAIEAEEELRDRIVALLGQLGFEGFWEDGSVLRSYISESRWTPAMPDEVERTVNIITRSSRSTRPAITTRRIQEQNWNEEWEKTIRPIHVSERTVITPSWHRYEAAPGELVLTIDPKMSFGTGYHESTRLILRLLEQNIRTGDNVLDMGTGTGVLAIAAVKLGAAGATGVDVDEWSYDNACENTRLNHVEDRITILHGDITATPAGPFTLILANIQRTVLLDMLPVLVRRLPAGGRMLLAGLLQEDRQIMMEQLRQEGMTMLGELSENEWIAIAARR